MRATYNKDFPPPRRIAPPFRVGGKTIASGHFGNRCTSCGGMLDQDGVCPCTVEAARYSS